MVHLWINLKINLIFSYYWKAMAECKLYSHKSIFDSEIKTTYFWSKETAPISRCSQCFLLCFMFLHFCRNSKHVARRETKLAWKKTKKKYSITAWSTQKNSDVTQNLFELKIIKSVFFMFGLQGGLCRIVVILVHLIAFLNYCSSSRFIFHWLIIILRILTIFCLKKKILKHLCISYH